MSRHIPLSGSLPNADIRTGMDLFTDATFPNARCDQRNGVDPEMWFLIPGPNYQAELTDAMELCTHCDERHKCLMYAIDNNIHEGIWGGLLPNQRRIVKKDMNEGWRLELR